MLFKQASDMKSKALLHHYDDKYFEENIPKLDPYLKYIFLNYHISRKKTDEERIRVLDVGCGPGIYLNFFKENSFEAYGIDLSPSACKLTKQTKASVTHLPFKNNCFDVVVLVHVIEHLAQKEVKNFLSEAHRVLKLSGKLFVMTPNIWSIGRLIFGSRWFEDPTHINLFAPNTLKKSLERNGFTGITFRHKIPPIIPHKGAEEWVMPYYGLQVVWRKFPFLQDIIFFLMNSTPISYLRDVIYVSAENDETQKMRL